MIRSYILALALAGSASAAAAQASADPHAGHAMPAQTAAPAAADPHAGHQAPPPQSAADPHAGHVMPEAPVADPHAGHAMGAATETRTGADLPVGRAAAPPAITDALAEQVFGAAGMRRAQTVLAEEHGGSRVSKVQADMLEWAPAGRGYRWQIEGWYGGDLNRFVLKTEGEGQSGEGVESAEVQLLYSRATGRYTDVQVGLRHDLEPRSTAYAVLAVDAMFPYWFEAEGSLFLSQSGDLLARIEGNYDFRLAQRLVLQPRAELEFSAQNMPRSEIGSGLSQAELGLRLRYEIRREFAPYLGVVYERAFGKTGDYARANAQDVDSLRVLVGLRAWF